MVRRAITPVVAPVAAIAPPEIVIVKAPAALPKPIPSCSPDPNRRYNREKCEIILKQIVDKAMKTFEYSPEEAKTMGTKLSQDIKTKIKSLDFDRYRLICSVTIGEKYMQSFNYVMRFLWDTENDDYATYVFDTPGFYVIATIFGVYLE